jgi:rhodanese-related sulfurtransferase
MTTTKETPPMSDTLITPSELRHLLTTGTDVHLIDVRTSAEFDNAHIPGSYHVPLDTLGEHRDELSRHLTHPTVLVCQSGGRARQASQQLATTGLGNVRVLDGGLGSWLAVGGEVNRGQQRWGMERQVRLVAGAAVLLSVLASFVVSPLRLVAAFVGAGLTFSAVTNTCGMAAVLAKLPYNAGAECDVRDVIAQLEASTQPADTAHRAS